MMVTYQTNLALQNSGNAKECNESKSQYKDNDHCNQTRKTADMVTLPSLPRRKSQFELGLKLLCIV